MSAEDDLTTVADACRRKMSRGADPVVVAVDGHSAAGKSAFAVALSKLVAGSVVRGDDFYAVIDYDQRARLSPAQGVESYYDWRRLRDEVLLPLRRREPVKFRPYDWDRNLLASNVVEVAPAGAIVVEGLFVARPELQALVDISVLVEASAEVRAERQVRRNDASPDWLERWDLAECHYLSNVCRPESFDFRVSGR